MVGRTEWPAALKIVEDDKLYTLKELQAILADLGQEVHEQALYHWIRRKNVRKRGTISDPNSSQNLVVYLGADIKEAVERHQ